MSLDSKVKPKITIPTGIDPSIYPAVRAFGSIEKIYITLHPFYRLTEFDYECLDHEVDTQLFGEDTDAAVPVSWGWIMEKFRCPSVKELQDLCYIRLIGGESPRAQEFAVFLKQHRLLCPTWDEPPPKLDQLLRKFVASNDCSALSLENGVLMSKDRCIYSSDGLRFIVTFYESISTFICGPASELELFVRSNEVEGFWATDETPLFW